MDNMDSMEKLNGEFVDKKVGGFKYWFWTIWTYIFNIAATYFAFFGFGEKAGATGLYFSLLTLVGGAFAIQAGSWAKGTGKRTKPLLVSFIWGLVNVAIACVILYIVMPIIKG